VVTTPYRRSDHRAAGVLLIVLVVISWAATVALPLIALSLLLGVDAPADRTTTIVVGWFLTPFLSAAGLTVGLIVFRRSRRIPGGTARSRNPPS
jgi:hypothetical protein